MIGERRWARYMALGEESYTFVGGLHVPQNMMPGILRYIQKGIQPGDFLRAIIVNDLRGAVARADDQNMPNIPAFAAYFYNVAPGMCWGDEKRYDAWLEKGGVRGWMEDAPRAAQ